MIPQDKFSSLVLFPRQLPRNLIAFMSISSWKKNSSPLLLKLKTNCPVVLTSELFVVSLPVICQQWLVIPWPSNRHGLAFIVLTYRHGGDLPLLNRTYDWNNWHCHLPSTLGSSLEITKTPERAPTSEKRCFELVKLQTEFFFLL